MEATPIKKYLGDKVKAAPSAMSRPEIVTPQKVLCVNSEKLVFKGCDLDFLLVA
jgi:hypothetical protein